MDASDVVKAAFGKATKVQTLIFDKGKFDTAEKAKKWAEKNGFSFGKVDETGESFRLRQEDPEGFQQEHLRTIELTDGVKAVVGRPKE